MIIVKLSLSDFFSLDYYLLQNMMMNSTFTLGNHDKEKHEEDFDDDLDNSNDIKRRDLVTMMYPPVATKV